MLCWVAVYRGVAGHARNDGGRNGQDRSLLFGGGSERGRGDGGERGQCVF